MTPDIAAAAARLRKFQDGNGNYPDDDLNSRLFLNSDLEVLADAYLTELDDKPATWEWCQQDFRFTGGVACWIQGTSLRLVRHVDATGISIWAAKNVIVEQATRGQVRTAARLFGVELREQTCFAERVMPRRAG